MPAWNYCDNHVMSSIIVIRKFLLSHSSTKLIIACLNTVRTSETGWLSDQFDKLKLPIMLALNSYGILAIGGWNL